MNRLFISTMLATVFVITCSLVAQNAQPWSFEQQLVLRYAPIHHQDVDQTGGRSLGGKSDYITAVNFDGNWDCGDNWKNIAKPTIAATAHCYYSVVTTDTHWYIVYAFFHPRDWADHPLADLWGTDEHENDMEGMLAIIQRPAATTGNDMGKLLGLITVSHHDFYSFTPAGSPLLGTGGGQDIDGRLRMVDYNGQSHPVTAQEAKGHGLKAEPHVRIDGDGIVYFPTLDTAEAPSGPNDRNVKYKLVDIFEPDGLWARRSKAETFDSFGTFKGGGANGPWGWDDGDDGTPQAGELATDPAKVAAAYFKNFPKFSQRYVSNRYSSPPGVQRHFLAQIRVRNRPLSGQGWRSSENFSDELTKPLPRGAALVFEIIGSGSGNTRFDIARDNPGGDDTVLRGAGPSTLAPPLKREGRGYYIGGVINAPNEWFTVKAYWQQ